MSSIMYLPGHHQVTTIFRMLFLKVLTLNNNFSTNAEGGIDSIYVILITKEKVVDNNQGFLINQKWS